MEVVVVQVVVAVVVAKINARVCCSCWWTLSSHICVSVPYDVYAWMRCDCRACVRESRTRTENDLWVSVFDEANATGPSNECARSAAWCAAWRRRIVDKSCLHTAVCHHRFDHANTDLCETMVISWLSSRVCMNETCRRESNTHALDPPRSGLLCQLDNRRLVVTHHAVPATRLMMVRGYCD